MRMQARRGNGRWTRNTMENTLGLHCAIHGRKANGEWCGALNPSRVGEPRPTMCHSCGEHLEHGFVAEAGEPSRVKYGEDDVAHCAVCGQAEDRPIHRLEVR